jgi:hypothetical protein
MIVLIAVTFWQLKPELLPSSSSASEMDLPLSVTAPAIAALAAIIAGSVINALVTSITAVATMPATPERAETPYLCHRRRQFLL